MSVKKWKCNIRLTDVLEIDYAQITTIDKDKLTLASNDSARFTHEYYDESTHFMDMYKIISIPEVAFITVSYDEISKLEYKSIGG